MISSYKQALSYLEKFIPSTFGKHEGELGFNRMKFFLDLLGNPEMKFASVHVAGTSGKGSTATFISSILQRRYKVGLHTSPHLVKVNERIKINGKDIDDTDFMKLLVSIIEIVEKMGSLSYGLPSYFEIVTALAFLYFVEKNVDIAVVEAGMGGKYDGTNVILPLAGVITNIGLDHIEILGNTVEKIAGEKAGIIKKGIQVISGISTPTVKKIIIKTSIEKSAKPYFLFDDFSYTVKKEMVSSSIFDYSGESCFKNLKIKMIGRHQVENATLAVRTVEAIGRHVKKIKKSDIRKGLLSAFIPGRMEKIQSNPFFIFDGAHNEDKARALRYTMESLFKQKAVTTILAIKEGKDVEGIMKNILPFSTRLVLTSFKLITDQGKTFSYDPGFLYDYVRKQKYPLPVFVVYDSIQAVKKAKSLSKENDVILITGSLYLIGEIKHNLNKD